MDVTETPRHLPRVAHKPQTLRGEECYVSLTVERSPDWGPHSANGST